MMIIWWDLDNKNESQIWQTVNVNAHENYDMLF